jgi:hypothetical protein
VEFREGDSFDRKLFHRGPSARERLYDPFEGL